MRYRYLDLLDMRTDILYCIGNAVLLLREINNAFESRTCNLQALLDNIFGITLHELIIMWYIDFLDLRTVFLYCISFLVAIINCWMMYMVVGETKILLTVFVQSFLQLKYPLRS